MDVVSDLTAALTSFGFMLRGSFGIQDEDGDSPLELPVGGTVVLVGNAGGAMWRVFARQTVAGHNPLNDWTRAVIEPIARAFDARPLYPFGEPVAPFQRWAMRAEPVHRSPLGLLIHPDFGLWHAYRAALVFAERLILPRPDPRPSPCEACPDRPCLSACPAGAFTASGYDVPACADQLTSSAGAQCLDGGCRSRDACPVGRDWRSPDAQIRFHMAAFARSMAPASRLTD